MPLVCTIHQPLSILFEYFDCLLLLARGGKTVYFGDIGPNSRTLLDYFERHGALKCEHQENPATKHLRVTLKRAHYPKKNIIYRQESLMSGKFECRLLSLHNSKTINYCIFYIYCGYLLIDKEHSMLMDLEYLNATIKVGWDQFPVDMFAELFAYSNVTKPFLEYSQILLSVERIIPKAHMALISTYCCCYFVSFDPHIPSDCCSKKKHLCMLQQ